MLYAFDMVGIFVEKIRSRKTKLFVGFIFVPSLHNKTVDIHVLIGAL